VEDAGFGEEMSGRHGDLSSPQTRTDALACRSDKYEKTSHSETRCTERAVTFTAAPMLANVRFGWVLTLPTSATFLAAKTVKVERQKAAILRKLVGR